MIRLVKPTPGYEDQVMTARQAFLDASESFDGCAGLENCATYAEWCNFEGRLRQLYAAGYVPSTVYLAVRTEDDRAVGIIDCREYLSDFLLRYGGHIGYCICVGRATPRKCFVWHWKPTGNAVWIAC